MLHAFSTAKEIDVQIVLSVPKRSYIVIACPAQTPLVSSDLCFSPKGRRNFAVNITGCESFHCLHQMSHQMVLHVLHWPFPLVRRRSLQIMHKYPKKQIYLDGRISSHLKNAARSPRNCIKYHTELYPQNEIDLPRPLSPTVVIDASQRLQDESCCNALQRLYNWLPIPELRFCSVGWPYIITPPSRGEERITVQILQSMCRDDQKLGQEVLSRKMFIHTEV